MNRLITRLLTSAAAIALWAPKAGAQDYRFGVPEMQMEVTVKPDASVQIVYEITLHNQPGAHVIDIVDIGAPHKGYKLSNVRASSGGRPLSNIRHSTVVKPGFEVHLGPRRILPGREGKLHVEFNMPDMVFQDTTNPELASLRITPTWFGSRYVRGTTHLQVAIQLPKSVKPEEVLHQGRNFQLKSVTDEGARVGWDWPATRLTQAHLVAVSFPKRDLARVVKVTKLDLLRKWFRESTEARVIAGLVFLGLFAFLFFRFTGGTGFSVFFVLSGVAVFVFFVSPGLHLLSLPIVVVLIGINQWYLGHRKLSYLPPIAQVEGGGIKRGLTAPEAAALLEMPIAKVLSLVIFGMLKKGLVRQTRPDPLTVEVDEALRIEGGNLPPSEKERDRFYRKAGQKKGVVVHKYEHPFLYLLQNNPGKPVKEINFAVPIKGLLQRAAARMRGFDLSDTQEYYRAIVHRASRQAKAIGDISQREKAIDRNFEWILMDDDYPTVFTSGRPYYPVWTRGSFTGTSGTPSAAPSGPSIPGQTSFGDVSASFAGWAENTMGSVASAISPGSLGVAEPSGGLLNLSGADRVTGDFFKALGEAAASGSGGGGGFSGGGCACACAGCACACACAGGGR